LRSGCKTVPLYTTLSHCWGSLEIFKLKKSNIDSLHDGFPYERLPKTFQDAMKVTQSLGFKHIWIDSLCIVQDDVEDWRRESSLMRDVYGNATLNIAATYAKDGSEGLFVERGTRRLKRRYIRTPNKRLLEIHPSHFYEKFIASAPLSSRAWTFQERYLAHRTLHFSADELFWECRERMASETFPDGFPMATIHPIHQFPSRDDLTSWCQTISIYSKADLTYTSDKMIAISGVARNFQERFPDQYLAGLWKGNLGRQLCWAVQQRDTKPETKPTVYRAPSWSWASTDQPVSWKLLSTVDVSTSKPNQDVLVRLLYFNSIPVGIDLLGQLKDAKLELACGPILKETFFHVYRLDSKDRYKGFYLDDGSKDFYDADEEFAHCESLYLPILEHRERKYGGKLRIYGLMLKKADIRGKGYFSRIGVFDKAFKKDSYADVMESLSGHDDMFMEESWYQQVLEPDSRGIKQYSITLI
jgi:hypothetical protein